MLDFCGKTRRRKSAGIATRRAPAHRMTPNEARIANAWGFEVAAKAMQKYAHAGKSAH